MSKRRQTALCSRCQLEFIPDIQHKRICPTCQNMPHKNQWWRKLTRKCPNCGKPITPRNKTCRQCRWKDYQQKHICPDCGQPKGIKSKRCITCANAQRGGSNHPMWKGGKYLNDAGYAMVYQPSHPRVNSNGYVREHIKVWMDAYGEIPKGYVIHHLNGVKSDNRLENLSCIPKGKHQTFALINAMQSRITELEART